MPREIAPLERDARLRTLREDGDELAELEPGN
jgi:hypothetical protein